MIEIPKGKKDRVKRLEEFAHKIEEISEKIKFKISSRGWCYQLEAKNVITKAEFDNECKDSFVSYLEKILSPKNQGSVTLNFSDFVRFDPKLADFLLDEPEELLIAAEIAIEQICDKKLKEFSIQIVNLPDSQNLKIGEIRSEHLGKLYSFDGIISQRSDVKPQVTRANFECPNCSTIIPVLQLDQQFKEPIINGEQR